MIESVIAWFSVLYHRVYFFGVFIPLAMLAWMHYAECQGWKSKHTQEIE